jgi:Uma2 family endonuclease
MGTKTLLTLEEFLALPEDGYKHELSEGELVVMPSAARVHVRVVGRINWIFSKYVNELRLGEVYSEPLCLLSRDPAKTMRQPDVAFYSRARLDAMPGDLIECAPELAVEVISPGNTADYLARKVEEYFAAGAIEIWAVYPELRIVWIYRSPDRARKLSDKDTITFDLLPGWSAPVADFFDLDY